MKSVALLGLVLALSGLTRGQELPKPTLIDEFGRISCDEYLSRVDNFLVALANDPTSRGVVVVQGDAPLRRRLAYELWLGGALRMRGFDASRIRQLRGPDTGDVHVRLWLVQFGAEEPVAPATAWDFSFSLREKPYVFHSEMEHICSSPNFAAPYKEYLDANAGSRGHVVIYTSSGRSFRRALRTAKAQLGNIRAEKLRYFHVRVSPTENGDYSYAEYWLVPKRRR
jgi:hypothetical protein